MTNCYHMPDLNFEIVHAYEMTDTVFKYKCSCKKGFHIHGNGGDPFHNRIEYRSSHCLRSPQQPNERSSQSIDLEIVIDDRTVRKLKKQKSKSK
jgi:hypothetical protein